VEAEAIAEYAKQCYQCSICSGTCPKARVVKGFLPRRMVYNVITGNAERVVNSGDAWVCLTCRECQVKCPMKIDFVDMVRGVREKMLKKGLNCIIAHDNTFGSSLINILKDRNIKPQRKQFLAKDVEIDDSSDVLYFMGCVTYMDVVFKDDVGFEGMGIADNTIRLLNAVGIKPAVIDGEKCCGHDQLWRGQKELFEELGRQNIEYLKKYKTIVTSCPECYRTLAVDYKEKLGAELNVKHVSEFLLEHKDKLKGRGKGLITYHDSCRLGRYMGIYDAPRELLKAMGYELTEMKYVREDALCCGVPQWVNCDDENKEIRRRKMKDAVDTGAEVMVTPCAKCQIHLKCLQMDKGEKGSGREYNIKIKDLSTALMEGLDGS
jgi:Fe-S oxidoreductase